MNNKTKNRYYLLYRTHKVKLCRHCKARAEIKGLCSVHWMQKKLDIKIKS